jgi:hypothetical protein
MGKIVFKLFPKILFKHYLRRFVLEDFLPQCKQETCRIVKNKQNKLRGPQSASELYRLSERHLSTKFSANFCG